MAPHPDPRSLPPRRRREEVLQAAGALFAAKGYAAASTTEIADRLGILRGSVYYYFATKESLLFELIEDVYVGALEALDAILASDADAIEKLRLVIERHVTHLAGHQVATTLFLNEFRSLSPEHQAIVAAKQRTYEQGVLAVIREGQRTGVLRDDLDDGLVMLAVLGAVNWVHRWYRRDQSPSSEEIGRQFASVLLEGLIRR